MDISSAFTPARGLQTRTDGAAYDFRRPGTLGDLSPAILAQLVSAKVNRTNAPARAASQEPEYRVTNMPQGGDEAVGRSSALPRKITRMRRLQGAQMPGQSYEAMRGWGAAGGGPAAGITYQDVAEDYLGPGAGWSLDNVYGTLEGNEAAARQSMAQQAQKVSGGDFPPGDDPRMRALVAAQEAARRTPGSLVGSAVGRGVRR